MAAVWSNNFNAFVGSCTIGSSCTTTAISKTNSSDSISCTTWPWSSKGQNLHHAAQYARHVHSASALTCVYIGQKHACGCLTSSGNEQTSTSVVNHECERWWNKSSSYSYNCKHPLLAVPPPPHKRWKHTTCWAFVKYLIPKYEAAHHEQDLARPRTWLRTT